MIRERASENAFPRSPRCTAVSCPETLRKANSRRTRRTNGAMVHEQLPLTELPPRRYCVATATPLRCRSLWLTSS